LLVGATSTSSISNTVLQGRSNSTTGGALLTIARGSNNPANNDELGLIYFADSGHAGAAIIDARRDGGTWTSNTSMPSKLSFSTTADGASTPTTRATIDSSGRLGLGTTSPNGALEIASSAVNQLIINDPTSTGNGNKTVYVNAIKSGTGYHNLSVNGYELYFKSGGSETERMRISSGGGLLINTTTHRDSARLVVDGDGTNANSVFYAPTTVAYSVLYFRNPNGNVGRIDLSGTSTSYATTSDYRVKENVSSLTGAIDRLNQLQVHRFNFIADPDKTVDGFIAHEAQAVVPECVTGTKDEVDADGNPIYQGIDQSKLVPLLTAALQEAIAKIETLEAKVAALETA
jgi:Chaperone of endosialidase